jgi:nitrite reductase (NO-forming) / hydroxylamine reductase
MKRETGLLMTAIACAALLSTAGCGDDDKEDGPAATGGDSGSSGTGGGGTGGGGTGGGGTGGGGTGGGAGGLAGGGGSAGGSAGEAGGGGVAGEAGNAGASAGTAGAAGNGGAAFACDPTKYDLSTYIAKNTKPIAQLYADSCQGCHGVYRQGNLGPNLLPGGQLAGQTDQQIWETLTIGRPGTSMDVRFFPEMAADDDDACAMVAFLRSPVDTSKLTWTTAEINASVRIMYPGKQCGGLMDNGMPDSACTITIADVEAALPAVSTATHDLENLMLVTERESRRIAVFDASATEGGTLGKLVGRIAASYRAHGYTFDPAMNVSDGSLVSNRKRWVYNVGRDGFLYKMDMVTLEPVARVRVGIDSRAIAVSDDGRYAIVGNYIPFSAVIVDTTTMKVAQYLDTTTTGTLTNTDSRVAGINATQRWVGYAGGAYTKAGVGGYFLMLLKDAGEAWRIDYTGTPGAFPIEKIANVGNVLHEAFNSEDQKTFFATAQGSGHMTVIDVPSWTEKLKITGGNKPHPGPGALWTFDVNGNGTIEVNETFGATIHIGDAQLLVWNVDKAAAGVNESFTVGTGGPGLFVNTTEATTGIWSDQTFSTTDTTSIMKFSKDPTVLADVTKRIDLSISGAVKLVHPEPDATGRFIYVSDWAAHKVYVLEENPTTPYAFGKNTVTPYKTFPDVLDPTGIFNTHRRYSPLGH